MNFQALALKFTSAISKLMGLSTPCQNQGAWLSVDGKDVVNGTNNFWGTLWVIIRTSIGDVVVYGYETLVRVFYAIGHWMLTIIDFIFVFVRQLIGMNTDFTSIEEVTQGDIIFQFIFNENVVKIIRNLLIFSIVLLILFSIFAILKSEFDYATGREARGTKNIIVNALRSLFLMALVPLVAIGSIIMSNAILKSLYMVTSGGNANLSMGTQIFIASTYDANAYRRYANQNLKIPITFNFSGVTSSDNLSGYYSDGTVAEMEEALKNFQNQDVWTRGYKTFLMFASNGFLNMDDVDELDRRYLKEDKISPYHSVYDINLYSRSEQYFIMADVVEYAMKQNVPVYFKSLKDVYDSYYSVPASLRLDDDSYMPIGKNGDSYAVAVKYDGDTEVSTFGYEYDKKKGVQSESDGVVFVMALEREIEVNTGTKANPKIKTYRYYYPLMNGLDEFATDYYEGTKNVVIAKGMFEDGKNPTAIKEEDGIVQFYRDDMNIPMLVDLFPKISYELPAGSTESLGLRIVKGTITALTGVDISQFIPYVYFSIDFFHLFTKTTNSIVDLENGRMKIDYNFTSTDFDKANVYKLSDFNLFIFVFASGLLISILIKILMGIVFRTLDVVTLAITYPAVLATLPIDNGSRFQEWVQKFSRKLLSIYSVIVGINVVLMLVPVAWNIDLFTKEDIAYAINVGELGASMSAEFLNVLMHFLLVLVAFASLEPFIKAVGGFLLNLSKDENKDIKTNTIIDDGKTVINDLQNLPKKVGSVVSGKVFIDGVKKVGEVAQDFAIPGKAIIDQTLDPISKVLNGGKKSMENAKNIAERFSNALSATGKEEDEDSKRRAQAQAEAQKNKEAPDASKGDVSQKTTDLDVKNKDMGTGEEKDKAVVTGVDNGAEKNDREKNKKDVTGKDQADQKAEVATQNAQDIIEEESQLDEDIKNSVSDMSKTNKMVEDMMFDYDTYATITDNDLDHYRSLLRGTKAGAEAEAEYDRYLEEVGQNKGVITFEDKKEALRRMALKSQEIAKENYKTAKNGQVQKLPGQKDSDKFQELPEYNAGSGDAIENMFDKGVQGINGIGATSAGGVMLSLAGKTLLKTGKLAYKLSKSAVKLAGKLTVAAGKFTLGITKTALKMGGRVVKTSAKALGKLALGEQGVFKTGLQILGGGVAAAGIGAVGVTKYGAQLGGRVVKASIGTTGNVASDIGTTFFAKKKKIKREQNEEQLERLTPETKRSGQINVETLETSAKRQNEPENKKNKGSKLDSKQKEEIYKQNKSKIDEEFEKAQKEQENESKPRGKRKR